MHKTASQIICKFCWILSTFALAKHRINEDKGIPDEGEQGVIQNTIIAVKDIKHEKGLKLVKLGQTGKTL